jgi:hypothetical protein
VNEHPSAIAASTSVIETDEHLITVMMVSAFGRCLPLSLDLLAEMLLAAIKQSFK